MRRTILIALAAITLVLPAGATTRFNWTDPSVTLTIINPFSATLTGFTQGDRILPFTVTITSVGSPFDASFSLLGGDPNALNLNFPPPRNSGTLMTVDVRLNNGWLLSNGTYTLRDVDASPGSGTYTDWRDRVTILNAGSTLTAVNPAFTQVSGLTATGFFANAPNGSTDGNVNVSTPGLFNAVRLTYGPAPGDGLASNQRFGLTEITIQDIITPEPGSWMLMGSGLILCSLGAVRRRRASLRR